MICLAIPSSRARPGNAVLWHGSGRPRGKKRMFNSVPHPRSGPEVSGMRHFPTARDPGLGFQESREEDDLRCLAQVPATPVDQDCVQSLDHTFLNSKPTRSLRRRGFVRPSFDACTSSFYFNVLDIGAVYCPQPAHNLISVSAFGKSASYSS